MSFSTILDVGIGLVIVYFIGALLVSGIQETIASIMQWRSKHLKESILQMMLDKLENPENPSPSEEFSKNFDKAKNLQEAIYKNSLIQSMNHISHQFAKDKTNSNPSYLEAETFATALIEVLKNDLNDLELKNALVNLLREPEEVEPSQLIWQVKEKIENSEKIPSSLKSTLCSLADRAIIKAKQGENKLLVFQQEIEAWFNRSMERASGVYKRNTQVVCFLLGLVIAIGLNIDSLDIYQRLIKDTTLRSTLVDGGQTMVSDYINKHNKKLESPQVAVPSQQPPQPDQQLSDTKESFADYVNQFEGDTLPITPINERYENLIECPNDKKPCKSEEKTLNFKKILVALLGWGITTLAIYMGAPFWFDLLSKLVNIRSTGGKPTK